MTDQIRTIREASSETVIEIGEAGKQKMLLAKGHLKDFAACFACVKRTARKEGAAR